MRAPPPHMMRLWIYEKDRRVYTHSKYRMPCDADLLEEIVQAVVRNNSVTQTFDKAISSLYTQIRTLERGGTTVNVIGIVPYLAPCRVFFECQLEGRDGPLLASEELPERLDNEEFDHIAVGEIAVQKLEYRRTSNNMVAKAITDYLAGWVEDQVEGLSDQEAVFARRALWATFAKGGSRHAWVMDIAKNVVDKLNAYLVEQEAETEAESPTTTPAFDRWSF